VECQEECQVDSQAELDSQVVNNQDKDQMLMKLIENICLKNLIVFL